jgi:hypothetical protein
MGGMVSSETYRVRTHATFYCFTHTRVCGRTEPYKGGYNTPASHGNLPELIRGF